MPTLTTDNRNKLEKAVIAARNLSEKAAKSALEALAVQHPDYYQHMTPVQRKLRNQLRAHARQLGDRQEAKGDLPITHLISECAYEHWHRMLFARFLAENNLLIEPDTGVAISLDECKELAKEAGIYLWTLAGRYAQKMLPQIFRADDPLLQVTLAKEDQLKLEQLLDGLPTAVYTASDALGWCYQFWQTERKKQVNDSGVKIGADELPAVTQLFTEDYMVDFLLDNTLGAWWAGKVITAEQKMEEKAQSEEELRRSVSLPGVPWTYLRFVKGEDGKWHPAAGIYDSWPKAAKELRCLDPCMGSGHFIVAIFERLVEMRIAEEKLGEKAVVKAVISDNLYGLEIDHRCTQIAAFNLALAAWRRIGYCALPAMHLACSGLGVRAKKEEWLALTPKSEKMQTGMERLYQLFQQAPVLGSLINPRTLGGNLLTAEFHDLQPIMEQALNLETKDEIHELAVAAKGIVEAAEILASRVTIVATNMPYLGFQNQDEVLSEHCKRVYPMSKADLATCFIERCLAFCEQSGTAALVTPQNWLFLSRFKHLRKYLLERQKWHLIARLGEHGFNSSQAAGAFTAMIAMSASRPHDNDTFAGLDVASQKEPEGKAVALRLSSPIIIQQIESLKKSDSIVTFETLSTLPLLSQYAVSLTGAHTLDIERFRFQFWELERIGEKWNLHASTPVPGKHYSGMEYASFTREEGDAFAALAAAMKDEGFLGGWLSGNKAWGKRGVACSWMRKLPASLYLGTVYDNSAAVIIPHNDELLPAVWCFCSSPDYSVEVRKINQKIQVANATLIKVPFDLVHWQRVAKEKYPHGLPKPFSSDPTQWLFNGHPRGADYPLQVAVARLLDYRWPRQSGSSCTDYPSVEPDGLEKLADEDGIVCIPSVRGEEPAAERLRKLLVASYGKDWNPTIEPELIRATGSESSDLEEWLLNDFFEQHCQIFHHRPFIWHIWDGRKRDGFHALVNYHKLTAGDGKGRRILESLTHSYLNDWITRQKDGVKRGEEGSEERLAAALELKTRLEAIIEGERPHDIFVRWKPLHQQSIGWEPDINDGVRLNIRPFMASDLPKGKKGAGILRGKPNIKWDKDRGKEPNRPKAEFPWFWGWDEVTEDFIGGKEFDGNRWNDCHYTNEVKRKARKT